MKKYTKMLSALVFLLTFSMNGFSQENDCVVIEGINYFLSQENRTAHVEQGPTKDFYKGDVVIPEKVVYKRKKYAVHSIDNRAFADCTELKSVSLPKSLTKISYGAFLNCKNLSSVTLPDGLCYIESKAFAGCSSLTSVTFPESLEMIGGYAFLGCTGITSVNIPKYVSSIGFYTFSGCSNLLSITVDRDNTTLSDGNGSNCIIYTKGNFLTEGCKNTIIPKDIRVIEAGAFLGKGLTSISIPATIESISPTSFSFNPELTSVKIDESNPYYNDGQGDCIIQTATNTLIYGTRDMSIPDNVEILGLCAFMGCEGLTSVNIPRNVKTIGDGVFMFCPDLEIIKVDKDNPNYHDGNSNCIVEKGTNTLISGCQSTVIPNAVKAIGKNAFYGCSTLKSIVIPDGVISIGENAFRECTELTSVTIPGSLKSIDKFAFWGCTNLSELNHSGNKLEMGQGVFHDCDKLSEDIKDELYTEYSSLEDLYVKEDVVEDETELTEVEEKKSHKINGIIYYLDEEQLTASVTNDYTEKKYTGAVNIPEKVGYKGKTYFVTSIDGFAFSDCEDLTSITIPNSVTSIGSYAFSRCTGLKSIILPESISRIDVGTFRYCVLFTSITIPENVKVIESYAFEGCLSLANVKLPSGKIQIHSSAFKRCNNLALDPLKASNCEMVESYSDIVNFW